MLGVMIVGAVEPAGWAAPPETKPAALTTPLAATDPSLASVFSGNNIPTAIKLKELTPEWRAMSTNGQLEIGNFQAFITSFGGGSFATSYYTKGQTVVIGAETYIVAYSLLTIVDKVSPEVSLNLSLLNLKTIGSMSNIRAFNTVLETKVLEKQLAALQLANVLDPTKEKPAIEAPVMEPCVAPPTPQPVMRKKRRTPRKNFRRSTRRRNR
jgi:hypothetical protein